MRILSIALVTFILGSSEAFALPFGLDEVTIKGHIIYEGKEKLLEIRVSYKKIKGVVLGGPPHYWGSDYPKGQYVPAYVIKELVIKIDGNQIHIPKNAYNDLGNPHIPTIPVWDYPKVNTFEFSLEGSENAGYYIVRFEIKDGKVIKRTLKNYNYLNFDDNNGMEVKQF